MERTNRIKWYFADDGATIYEGKHVFSPRIDSLDDDPTGLYEFTAKRTNARRYSAGRNEWDAHGLHVDGDAEDFLGQAPRAKYWVDDVPPSNPCGKVQHLGQGIQVGNTERDMSIHRANGIELGAKLRTLAHYKHGIELATHTRRPWANGIELGCRIADPMAHTREGMEFGVTALENQGNLIRLVEGIELGNVERSFVGKPQRLREGIELGNVEHSPRLKPERLKQGVELGCLVHHPSGDVETVKEGIELGNVEHSPRLKPERLKQGIELGCTVRKIASTVPTSSCSDSPLLEPGQSITFSQSPSLTLWVRFHVTPGTMYHLRMTLNSGPKVPAFVVFVGANTGCEGGSPSGLGYLTSATPCIDRTEDYASIWYINVAADPSTSRNFTFEFGTGPC